MGDGTQAVDPDAGPTVTETLDLLRHEYRRRILGACLEAERPAVELDEIIEAISEADSGREPAEAEIASELRHQHLPKLAEYGVIEYDERSRAVRYHRSEVVEALYQTISAYSE